MTPRAVGPEASGSSVSRRGFLRACAFALAGGAWPARADEKSPDRSAICLASRAARQFLHLRPA